MPKGTGYYRDSLGSEVPFPGEASAVSKASETYVTSQMRDDAAITVELEALALGVGGSMLPGVRGKKARRRRDLRGVRVRTSRHDTWKKTLEAYGLRFAAFTNVGEFLVPPASVAVRGLLGDDWWRKKGLWAIDVVTPNSVGTLLEQVLPYSWADATLVQESKLRTATEVNSATRAAKGLGWMGQFQFAHSTAHDKASGGAAVLARKGIGMRDNTADTIPDGFRHRLALAWVNAVCKGGFHS